MNILMHLKLILAEKQMEQVVEQAVIKVRWSMLELMVEE